MQRAQPTQRLKAHLYAGLPGLFAVALMLVWAAHDGGYDSDTWYWGALAILGVLAASVVGLGGARRRVPRAGVVAVGLFALYVAWSYLSITWAQSPGDALQGSNRALLYLLVFTLLLILPWTPRSALVALLTFAIGVGAIGVVLLFRLASDDHVASLVIGGRLASPTGYFNATAALFTIDALVCTALACRRELPGPVRGLLLALACAGLQLALIVQSRGWLFTLPLVALITVVVSSDRLRLATMAIIPVAGALAPVHRLLNVFHSSQGAALGHAAGRAGQAGLLICAAALVLGTLVAWGDSVLRPRTLSPGWRRAIGGLLSVAIVAGTLAAGTVATHNHPVRFVVRQWNGFSKPERSFSSRSHFGDVGSGRYDFWRVSLDAVLAHPVGGLGQDNFDNYYIKRGRSGEEPSWTHSLEMRLLAHTGFVGFALFVAFMIAAVALALRGRRRGDALSRGVAGTALLPFVVWLIHGSIDWFWEMPALSGPALGFLAVAGSLAGISADGQPARPRATSTERPWRRPLLVGASAAGIVAAAASLVALAFPYLSVREVSIATNVQNIDPAASLRDLRTAARLNPLDSTPGLVAGAIALRNGEWVRARSSFIESIHREPGGWLAWLGAGLAASAQGETTVARTDFVRAHAINRFQPAVTEALARVDTRQPLTSAQAFRLLKPVD